MVSVANRRWKWHPLALLVFAASSFVALGSVGATSERDPVSQLNDSLNSGNLPLNFEPKQGYLAGILKSLDIDPDSQVLVFSKSSMQSSHIGIDNPRAIYFNDETYVGWIPGAPLIEVMSVDPKNGAVFYTIPTEMSAKPSFKRESGECSPCHGGRAGVQAPGLIARSSHVAPSGYPRVFGRTFSVHSRSPIKQRWGGWYVTGTHGSERHMGNEPSLGTDNEHSIDMEKGSNVTDLSKYFDTSKYLSPHSDIVALMVLEHQMDVQNELSNFALRATGVLAREKSDDAARPELDRIAAPLVETLLCSGEPKFTSPIQGTSPFAAQYSKRSPQDKRNRSLSQLDLTQRLFKYPCSPLVYSRSFNALPVQAKAVVFRAMTKVLKGSESNPLYSHLTADDKKAVYEILTDTHPAFAEFAGTPTQGD